MIKNFTYKIILGSKSPRRKEILAASGLEFEVRTKEVEEIYPADLDVYAVPAYLAKLKATATFDLIIENEILLTADSVVIANDKIFGKPKNHKHAIAILKELSLAQKHYVVTGVCLMSHEKCITFSEKSIVYFEELSDEEIEYYVTTFRPFDKAGAYGIQEWIGLCKIKKIEGTYANIKGLPMHAVYRSLMDFGKDET